MISFIKNKAIRGDTKINIQNVQRNNSDATIVVHIQIKYESVYINSHYIPT